MLRKSVLGLTRACSPLSFAVGLAMCAPTWWTANASAATDSESPSRLPNVLFIVSDDMNTDLGCYGHELVRSPQIDRLAGRGVRFEHAYTQFPMCNPSRSSFLTGLYPQQTGVMTNRTPLRDVMPPVPTLPEWFAMHGCTTARVGKVFHRRFGRLGSDGDDDPNTWHTAIDVEGIDKAMESQIHSIAGRGNTSVLNWLAIESEDEQHTDGMATTEAIKLLERLEAEGDPFFLAVGIFRPHRPFVAPQHYFDLYPREAIDPIMMRPGHRDGMPEVALNDRPGNLTLDLDTRRRIIQAYYASISLVDAQVGRLLDALDRLGLARDTIIVFVSDHGFLLGEHGLWHKAHLFEGSTRVPLIIADPRQSTARRVAGGVAELVDLYPTLVDLCALPDPGHLVGRSLRPLLEDPSRRGREAAYTTLNRGDSVRTERYRYSEWGGGAQGALLYDYANDPDEEHDLASDPRHDELLETMRSLLVAARKRATQPVAAGDETNRTP